MTLERSLEVALDDFSAELLDCDARGVERLPLDATSEVKKTYFAKLSEWTRLLLKMRLTTDLLDKLLDEMRGLKSDMCPWCSLPRDHSPTRTCTGMEQ